MMVHDFLVHVAVLASLQLLWNCRLTRVIRSRRKGRESGSEEGWWPDSVTARRSGHRATPDTPGCLPEPGAAPCSSAMQGSPRLPPSEETHDSGAPGMNKLCMNKQRLGKSRALAASPKPLQVPPAALSQRQTASLPGGPS